MIKVVAYVNVIDFFKWTQSEQSKGWMYRTKVIDDKLLVYMERSNRNEKENNLV